jgi:hypothetical protein
MWSGKDSRTTHGRRVFRGSLFALAVGLAAAAGCSGRSRLLDGPPQLDGEGGETNEPGVTGGSSGAGGKSVPAAGSGGSAGSSGNAGKGGSAGKGSDPPYVDPGCPDAEAPQGIIECDPFSTPSGCGEGLACKPNIMHPYGTGCDQQVFSMLCRPAGPGTQGMECESTSDCAEGFICVVGAGAGTLCLHMCELGGELTCPVGFVCGETDAEGIGVCA